MNDFIKKILLVSWNIVNFHKLSQAFIKSPNFLLNSLKAQNISGKYCLGDVGQTLLRNLMKVHGIE
jgi:hypothetical protein